jgi:hypothetical protein
MQYKYAEIADTVYFWFAANDTTGTGADGATPLYDVRLAGAAANAAPTASGTPTLLSHANYSDGLHEIAIDTTGYAAGEYAVFCTLTVSTVNPAGFCGSFKLRTAGTAALAVSVIGTVAANMTQIMGTALTETATYIAKAFSKLFNVVDTNVPTAAAVALEATLTTMKGATFSGTTDSLEAIRDRGDAAWTSGTAQAIPYAPTSIAFTIGNDESPAGETFANLAAHDDVYVQCGENATTGLAFDVLATLVGKQTENPTLCRISAFYNGSATHELDIQAYNYVTAAYESVATMKSRTTFFDYIIPLDSDNHDPANGSMKIRFKHNVTTYNASHYLRVDYVSFEKRAVTDALSSDVAAILATVNDIDLEVDDIHTYIGTPVSIDSGTATLSGMLTKLADDNGGATFDATKDSLNKKGTMGYY